MGMLHLGDLGTALPGGSHRSSLWDPSVLHPLYHQPSSVLSSPGNGLWFSWAGETDPCSLPDTPRRAVRESSYSRLRPTDPVQGRECARRKISLSETPDYVNKRALPLCPPIPGNDVAGF